MAPQRIASIMAGVALGAVFSTVGLAGEADWKVHLEAGKRAGQSGDYANATQSFRLALQEAETFGATDPRLGETLNLLGLAYTDQRRPEQAESVLRQALAIREAALGVSHEDTNATRTNLANALVMQGRPSQAELLYKEAISGIEGTVGHNESDLEQTLMSLSTLYWSIGRRAVQQKRSRLRAARSALANAVKAHKDSGCKRTSISWRPYSRRRRSMMRP